MNMPFHRSMALLVAVVMILCTVNPTLSAGAQAGAPSEQAESSQLPVVHMPRDIRFQNYSYDPIYKSDRLITSGNLVYYIANDITYGRELWVSDGTPIGTHMVKDLHPGYDGFPYFYSYEPPLMGNRLVTIPWFSR